MDNAVGHDVEHLYRTLQEYLMKIWEWNAQRLNIEISAGCAMYPEDGKYVDEAVPLCGLCAAACQGTGIQGILSELSASGESHYGRHQGCGSTDALEGRRRQRRFSGRIYSSYGGTQNDLPGLTLDAA